MLRCRRLNQLPFVLCMTDAFRNQHPVPNAAYAPSKAAVHWITKRINAEEEKIAAWVQEPG